MSIPHFRPLRLDILKGVERVSAALGVLRPCLETYVVLGDVRRVRRDVPVFVSWTAHVDTGRATITEVPLDSSRHELSNGTGFVSYRFRFVPIRRDAV